MDADVETQSPVPRSAPRFGAGRLITLVVAVTAVAFFCAPPSSVAAQRATDLDDAAFLTDVYAGLLGRAPDVGGLAFWRSQLENGMSRSEVVAGIGDSDEQRRLVVRTVYDDALDRAPDPGGLTFWSEGILDRLTERALRIQVLSSPEFFQRAGGSDEAFITDLYRRVLARDPEPGGLAFWAERLRSGVGRQMVAASFLVSAEGLAQPDLSILAADPLPDQLAGSLDTIEISLDRAVDATGSAIIVAVDGRRVAGETRPVDGDPASLRFVPSERLRPSSVGGIAQVVVTVFAHDGSSVERADYGFTYRPSAESVPPGDDLMVAFYGHPRAPVLGVAGEGAPNEVLPRLLAQAEPYAASGRTVVPVFELIATLVTGSPGADGLYRTRTADHELRPYLDVVRSVGGRVVLDIQPGRADVLDEAMAHEAMLLEPDVGLALDPEWVVGPTQTPQGRIGTLDAADINRVSAYLSALVEATAGPDKILIIHRFRPDMVTNTDLIVSRPGVRIIFHADGEGGPAAKIADYGTLMPPRFERGIKIFYDEDVDMMSPADVLARLDPDPVFVSYQ